MHFSIGCSPQGQKLVLWNCGNLEGRKSSTAWIFWGEKQGRDCWCYKINSWTSERKHISMQCRSNEKETQKITKAATRLTSVRMTTPNEFCKLILLPGTAGFKPIPNSQTAGLLRLSMRRFLHKLFVGGPLLAWPRLWDCGGLECYWSSHPYELKDGLNWPTHFLGVGGLATPSGRDRFLSPGHDRMKGNHAITHSAGCHQTWPTAGKCLNYHGGF